VKIATWNVNGVRAREADVYGFLRDEQPDVLCLQEIKASPHQVPVSLSGHADYWSYWHGHKGYSGVALLVRKRCCPTRPRFSHPDFDHEQRVVVAEFDTLRVASLYVPNGGKDFEAKVRFLNALDAYVSRQRGLGFTLVLCGDLNVTRTPRDVHSTLRDESQLGQTAGERAQLERILGHGLEDLGRRFAPDDDALFTWWAPWQECREQNRGWRLDYVLASPDAAALATGCTAARLVGTSDHGPVTAVFEGALFKPESVVEGPAQVIAAAEPERGPQLDLFGTGR
jgi:exodeoxyribonuclease-3